MPDFLKTLPPAEVQRIKDQQNNAKSRITLRRHWGDTYNLDELLEYALSTVTLPGEEKIMESIFHESSAVIIGLQQNGGGITPKGEVLAPRNVRFSKRGFYIPNITDLKLNLPLREELAIAQIMELYGFEYVNKYGFDPKLYKPQGSKANRFFLVTPEFDAEKASQFYGYRDDPSGGLYGAYYSYIRGLFTRRNMPVLVSPLAIIAAIRRSNKTVN